MGFFLVHPREWMEYIMHGAFEFSQDLFNSKCLEGFFTLPQGCLYNRAVEKRDGGRVLEGIGQHDITC